MLSRFFIAFLPRSNHLFILWLQSTFAVILKPRKRKSVTVSTFPHSICIEVVGLDAMILDFLMLTFKPDFSLCSFTLIKRLFSSSSLSAIRVVSSAYLRLLIFPLKSWFQLVSHPVQHFAMMFSAYNLNRSGDNVQTYNNLSVRRYAWCFTHALVVILPTTLQDGCHYLHLKQPNCLKTGREQFNSVIEASASWSMKEIMMFPKSEQF